MGRKIAKWIGIALAVLVLAALALLGWLSLTEFRPAAHMTVAPEGDAGRSLRAGEPLTVLTWNIGYGALGDNADFFMDGGRGVYTADAARVDDNLRGIAETIRDQAPDLLLLQEVDRDSARSYHTDETVQMRDAMPSAVSAFANNFKVAFVPFPIPPIGRVDSGLLTLSAFPVREAERIGLPNPFSWPIRMANLKRCLLVERIPVEGSDRELVLVNLHLEAYDDGAGKAAQTEALKALLEAEAARGNYVIVGGDFNQRFSSVDASAYPQQEGLWQPGEIDAASFSEEWQLLMDPAVPSCRSLDRPYTDADRETFQYYLIDGFILSGNVRLQSIQTLDLDFICSDHNPVRAELILEP